MGRYRNAIVAWRSQAEFLKREFIIFGVNECKVYEHIEVRCNKCQRFAHFARECNYKAICRKCHQSVSVFLHRNNYNQ